MTSPAPVLESDRRVLKRPWILEKSWPATVVISSMASWLVTTTHTRPAHCAPRSSTMVWRLSMRLVSVPMYWPTSSTMNNRRNSPPSCSARSLTYWLIWRTSQSMVNSELLGVVEPALRGLAALGARLLEGVDHSVAVEVVGVALIEPFSARDLSIRGTERLGLALLVDVAFQARELEILAVEPEVLEEHAGEDAQDGGLVLVGRALGVDVEQDGLGGDIHGAARLGLDHGVLEARRDDVDRRTPVCRLAGEQVREHLEEVRFTGAEETRDPHADLVGGGVERALVGVEERREMPAQLVGHHVFGELLLDDLPRRSARS